MSDQQQSWLAKAAFFTAFGSAASILFSIAVSNILLALSLAALLMSGEKLRFPPIKLPLGLFMLGTVLSLAFSDNPWAGRVQIRKFLVFIMLLIVFSAFRHLRQVRWLIVAFTALGTLSAARALMQFAWQLKECGSSYGCLVGERITGFMSHWMTFGAHMMIVLMLLAAFLFWAPPPKRPVGLWVLCGFLISAAIFAGGTRSIWFATAVAGSYLLFCWKRWTVLIAPIAVALALLAAPPFLRQRFTSVWKPHGELDSNEHRRILWRTGIRMIRAHPLFGLGPERINDPENFKKYLPADITRLPEGWYGHLHNIYLQYAAERGIPTLLALLWMFAVILRDFFKALNGLPPGPGEARFVLQGAIAVILAILVGGILEHNLGDSEVLSLFLTTVACGYIAVESTTHEPAIERS
ncbi:MAG: O-antigen ligase family protein [Bryobacterales bacterium]|nr:O-antigen ligase family protein [Bryobacterales bacterium]